MDEIKAIREALEHYSGLADDQGYDLRVLEAQSALSALARLGAREAELTKDRDYWQALAMQFHDAVHAEIERRAKVEI